MLHFNHCFEAIIFSLAYRIGDAIKSWFELFNFFLKANQIIIAENLHASTLSDIAKSRELLKRQLHVITSSRSSISFTSRGLHNLPFELAGLAGARRVDPVGVIQSLKSATKQESRRACRRKRNARLQSTQSKCGPIATEPRSITSPSSGFTDCKSSISDNDLTDNILVTSTQEAGATDFTDSIDSVTATCNKSPTSI